MYSKLKEYIYRLLVWVGLKKKPVAKAEPLKYMGFKEPVISVTRPKPSYNNYPEQQRTKWLADYEPEESRKRRQESSSLDDSIGYSSINAIAYDSSNDQPSVDDRPVFEGFGGGDFGGGGSSGSYDSLSDYGSSFDSSSYSDSGSSDSSSSDSGSSGSD